MREIEFCGKRIDNGEWAYGYYVFQKECKRIGSNEVYYANYDKHLIVSNRVGEYWEVIPETVRQYIGLKDKNGKKIYKGDILLHSGGGNYKFVVEFLEGYFYLKGGFKEGFLDKIYFHQTHSHNFEVIGNIYDSPELLQQD